MRFALLFLFSGLPFLIGPEVRAFYEFGRGEFLLHTRGSAMYDSNVFAQEEPDDDFLFSFNPELQYVRRAGRSDLSVRSGVNIGRFAEFSNEDFEDFYAELSLGYPVAAESPLGGGIELGFRQDTNLSETFNERTKTDRYFARIDNTYRLNERIGLRNSLEYSRTEREQFRNVERIGGTLGTGYFYSENLSFNLMYGLRRSTSTGEADQDERESLFHSLTVGAEGQLTPRVSGTVSAGAQTSHAIHGDGRGRTRLVAGAGLNWAVRDNTNVTLDADRNQDLSAEGRTVERTSVSLGVNQRLTPKMDGNVFTGYRISDFTGDTTDRDETYSAGAGLNYVFTDRWNGGLEYSFNHTDSERREITFVRHTVTLSTSYTF